ALLYCERLFYLEEVEEIRVASAAVYAGRELHESLAAEEGDGPAAWESLELSSAALGVFGTVDCLKRRDGQLVPYEHTRGRPGRRPRRGAPRPAARPAHHTPRRIGGGGRGPQRRPARRPPARGAGNQARQPRDRGGAAARLLADQHAGHPPVRRARHRGPLAG